MLVEPQAPPVAFSWKQHSNIQTVLCPGHAGNQKPKAEVGKMQAATREDPTPSGIGRRGISEARCVGGGLGLD